MIVTTTHKIEGKKIVRVLGLVRGNTVRARHVGRDIVASMRHIIGGEIHEYTKLIAESREQARKDVEYGLQKWIGYANDIVPAPNAPPRGLADPAGWMVENERAIIGTPDDAVAKIEHMLEVTGGFGGILIFAQDWANWQATQRSLELIAEEVRPKLNASNVLRQASYDRNAPNQNAHRAQVQAAIDEAQARYAAAKPRS